MPVTIEFRLPASRAYLGEDIAVQMEIRNTGEDTAVVPDGTFIANQTPLYRLTGPQYPEGVRFNLAGIIEGADELAPPTSIAVPLPVRAGAVKYIQFRLRQLLPLTEPGNYELTAEVACGGSLLRSAPCHFELIEPEALAASFGRAAGPASDEELWSAWLLRSPEAAAIVRRMSHWPEDGDILDDGSTERVAAAGPHCLAPVSATVPPGAKDHQWLVYADGSRVFAHGQGLQQPVFIDRPGKVTAIVPRPATLTMGALEVFVLEQDRTISLLEFYPPEEIPDDEPLNPSAEASPGAEGDAQEEEDDLELFRVRVPEAIWSTTLPVQPQAIATARTAGEWPSRRLVYVYEAHGGVVVQHLVLDEDCLQTTEGTAFLPEVRLAGKSTPAFRIEQTGRSHVNLMVWRRITPTDPDDSEQFTICTAALKFDSSGVVCITAGTTINPVCEVEAEPVDAAIDWYSAPGEPERRDWAIMLRNGRMLRNPEGGRDVEPDLRPVLPLELLSLKLATCLAVYRPGGGAEIRFV